MSESSLQNTAKNHLVTIPEVTGTPSIFVGSFNRYHPGYPDGYAKWWYLSNFSSKKEFYDALYRHFTNWEGRTEFMFQDYENIPHFYISESHIQENFWAEFLNATEYERDLICCAIGLGYTLEEIRDKVFGPYNSLEDLVENHIDMLNLGDIPEKILCYIDENLVLRDLFSDNTLAKIGDRYYLILS